MKRYTWIFFLLFAQLALPAQVRIVVLGSSTAAGIGPTHIDSSWVNKYRTYLQAIDINNEVINLAKGGLTTFHLVPVNTPTVNNRPKPSEDRNIDMALSLNPDAIVINLPSNDAAKGYPVVQQLANYDIILEKAMEENVPVWITTPQGRSLNIQGRMNLIEMRDSTLARYGDKAIDFWTYIGQSNGSLNSIYNSGDGVHLNDRGHQLLFERVVEKQILQILSTNVNNVFSSIGCKYYPNPTTDLIHLNFDVKLQTGSSVTILNNSGQFLIRYDIKGGRSAFIIEMKDYPRGMYFLIIRDQKKYKIIKVLKL